MTWDDATPGTQMTGGVVSGTNRRRSHPRFSREQCGQSVKRVDAVLGGRRYVGANRGQALGTPGCTERSGDLLLELDHSQIRLCLVIRERDSQVLSEESDLAFQITQGTGEVVGLLLQVVALAPCRLRVGGEPRFYDCVVVVNEAGEHLGSEALLAGRSGIFGSALHLDEQVGHRARPLGLVPHDCHRGEIPDQMSSADSVFDLLVFEV